MANKTDWIMLFSRGMSIQKGIDYADGIGKAFKDEFGKSLPSSLYIREKENLECYYKSNDLEMLQDHLTETVWNPNLYAQCINSIEKDKKILIKINNLINKSIKKTNSEIAECLLNIRILKKRFYPILWYRFIFEQGLEKLFFKVIKKYPQLNPDVFLEPDEPTFIFQEQIDLIKIAKNPSEKLLQKHEKEYGFIPMYDYSYDPYDIDYFKNRLNKIKNPEKELTLLLKDFKEKNNKFKEAIKKVSDPRDKRFLEFFHFLAWFKDERSRYRNSEAYVGKPFYKEIAKRLNLTLDETLDLTYDEIVEGLNGKLISREEIDLRKESYALLVEGDKVKIFTGKAYKLFIKENIKQEIINEVKGISVSSGKVKGKAKIILNSKDLPKVAKGDIIICPMTRPDFLIAMEKAAAFVTDEGGLLCHAAIIAREMKKPCIIGTKNATKAFDDGDLVEVDGDDSVVRKI
jgi:phosphohistidine swiveling domain-containing protein